MQTRNKKAFTMVELVFVIVVIGILSAIALPRFGDTADAAYITKAQSALASVRAAMATERQRRILRGDTTDITDLSLKSDGTASANAFDHFSADQDGVFSEALMYAVKKCSTTGQRACWDKVDATHYEYRFPKSGDGTAKFVLTTNNRLDCDNDAADCLIITQ